MEASVRHQPFDGDDVAPCALEGEEQARQGRLAVDQHGARAAFPELAPVLGPGQLEVFAQHFKERLVPVNQRLDPLRVDRQRETRLGARLDYLGHYFVSGRSVTFT
jgi:hypothetical protein